MRIRKLFLRTVVLLLCLGMMGGTLRGFDFSTIEKKISDFTLDNGLKFIVLEDHSVPVVSFSLMVDVGGADDPKGYYGIAHVFEHMAFVGTEEVGSKDYTKEAPALAALDSVYYLYRGEEKKGAFADTVKLADLRARFETAQAHADSLIETNEFAVIVEREGGVGLNAGTGYDNTTYYCSYPSNKAELWFAMEGGRFKSPVFRQFYSEKEVIKEERRMATESSPVGRLVEEFLGVAFKAHPYGASLVGPMSDIHNIDKNTAMKFFRTYYVPSNMIIGVAGDITPAQVRQLAQTYFGSLPKVPKPDRVTTEEPEQNAERRVAVFDKSQPFLLMGFHRSSGTSPDDPVYDAIADYLGQGRTSMLYESLVKEKKIATGANAFGAFPGNKYACLFGIFVVPAKGVTAQQCEEEVWAQIEKLKSEPIPDAELAKIKARAKASFVAQLSSNTGLASQLAYYQNMFGDWRELFRSLDKINAVTAQDVQRVAAELLARKNCTVGYIESVEG
jgi:predicted Zn-dependent peptidase